MSENMMTDADTSGALTPPPNNVAVRGLDTFGETVFELQRQGAQLVRIDREIAALARLLIFFDPEATEEKALFIWPVLQNTFQINPHGPGGFELKGKARSFLPEADRHGRFDFVFNVTASATTNALLKFSTIDLGGPVVNNLECSTSALAGATFNAYLHREDFNTPHYAEAGLLELHKPSTFDVRKLKWNLFARFKQPSTEVGDTLHARFVLEREIEFPVSRDVQSFSPFGLACKGDEYPVRGGTGGLPEIHYMMFAQRLPWDWTFDLKNPGTGSWLVRARFPQSVIFDDWNSQVVKPITEAVNLIDAGRPITTFPELQPEGSSDPRNPPAWDAWFSFVDRFAGETIKKDDYLASPLGQKPGGEAPDKVTIVSRRITPPTADSSNEPPRAAATFLAIKCHDSGDLCASFECVPVEFLSEKDYDKDEGQGTSFRLQQAKPLTETPAPQPQAVRMGAFDLDFLPAARKTGDHTKLEASTRHSEYQIWWETDPNNTFNAEKIRHRRANVVLGVSAAAAGGEDDIPGEEYVDDLNVSPSSDAEVERRAKRSRPLVLSLKTGEGDPWIPQYALVMDEGVDLHSTQTINFNLYQLKEEQETSPAAGHPIVAAKEAVSQPTQALIIDDEPWLIAVVNLPPLTSLDPDLTTEVANWTNRTNIGVSWQVQTQQSGFRLLLPPAAIGEAMHRRLEDKDITPGQPIDFRFTPPAKLDLQPQLQQRRFTEPGWNLRRITEAPSGAGLIQAEFELLYGIKGLLRPENVRVSEIAVRLGSFPGRQPPELPWEPSKQQSNVFDATRNAWFGILGGLRTRPAVLEPWSPVQKKLFVTQDDGLRYELRPSASLYYPIPDSANEETDDFRKKYFSPDGLKGGWSWGFESRNVLNTVLRAPKSFAGTLSDFYLSSFGGWGQQRAVFDRGLSTIISRVDMGRASTIVIERIGRISVFWNRAKHVIVYERTVTASRQFYQEQYPLVGNPVLRKVDEYIEILESERGFPENDTPPAARGFVTACRFADGQPPRIRVNSRWGQDIGKTGWKIPLWIRGAQPSDVYPKPTIYAVCAGAPGESVPIALDDPDKLYFYTSTDQSLGTNTNTWPAVESVDFQAVDPSWMTPPKVINVSPDPADYKFADVAVRLGIGSFTLRLQPSPAPVNYVEGRTEKAIRAIPRSITIMRGAIAETITPEPAADAVRDLRSNVENAFSAFVAADPIEDFDKALHEFDGAFSYAKDNCTLVMDVVKNGTSVCDKIKERIGNQFEQFAQQTKMEALSALQQVQGLFLERAVENLPIADMVELRAKLRAILTDISQDAHGARGQLRRVHGLPGEALAKLDLVCDDLRELNLRIDVAFSTVTAALAELKDWTNPANPTDLAEARKVFEKLQRDGEAFLKRSGIDYQVAEITRTWLGTLPDKGRLQLDQARRHCAKIIDDLLRDLASTKPDITIDRLRMVANQAFETILTLIDQLESEWRSMFDPDSEDQWPIESAMDDLVTVLDTAIDQLTETDKPKVVEYFNRIVIEAFAKLDQSIDALIAGTGVSPAAGELARRVCAEIMASAADLENFINEVFNNEQLNDLRKLVGIDPAQLFTHVDNILSGMLDDIGGLISRAQVHLPSFPLPEPRTLTDDVLRLCRSFGDVPSLPNLKFNLPQIGTYFFSFDTRGLPNVLPSIDISPIGSYANQLGQQVLNGVNLTVPVKELLDRLIPADLPQFELSKVFPRIAGLDLSNLFRGIWMPSMANDGVRVTHGIDESTRSGWLQTDVNIIYQEKLAMFDLAGVKLVLSRAKFTGMTRLEATLGQPPRQRASGAIRGDWGISAGGMELVELNDCTLQFDEGGRIRFEVSPSKVRLKPPLDFLSDILAPFGSDNGFHVAVTPTGVQTTLYLPVPPVQAGSFGIANLVLGFLFGIDVLPEFKIRTALSIGRETRPFTFTVFILGGAGYFNFGLDYVPRTRELITSVSIAIFASASLAISLGPVSGGIYAYLGIAVDYKTSNQQGSNLTVTLKIMFVGEVCLLGFISVGMTLGLDAGYDNERNLTGRGYVSYNIKIGWFIDISVNADVSYTFGKGTTSSSSTEIQTAADSYVDMF